MEEELLPEYDNLSFSGFSTLQEDSTGSHRDVKMQSLRNSLSSSVDNNNSHNEDEDDFFEFSVTIDPLISGGSGYNSPDMAFCGKINVREEDQGNHEYQKRDDDYLTNNVNIIAVEKAAAVPAVVLAGKDIIIRSRSADSTIKRNSSYCYNNNNNSNYGIQQKVNITSLTSMSSKSRKRMFMFGPVKFHPEMELSALKERQSRGRVPTTMFPPPPPPPEVLTDGEKKAVLVSSGAAGGAGNNNNNNNKPPTTTTTRGKLRSNWRLLVRLLKGRSPVTTVLAKSLGCMMITQPQVVGMEKWIN